MQFLHKLVVTHSK